MERTHSYMTKFLLGGIGIWLLLAGTSSCVNVRTLQYMQGSFDTAKLSAYNIPQPVVQKGDLLSIVVYSDNPAATALYNQSIVPTGNTGGSSTVSAVPGYLVDDSGNIQFQGIGSLHAEGLTKTQLIDSLNARLKDYLIHPYYNIRFMSYKITLIGDIAKPGVYSIPSERVNILEAIGLAGDLNITGRRDNILVIREQNGKREWGRIDLTKPDIFTSPFYQLQENDVVYVDLTKNKAASSDQVTIRNISLATSLISTAALIITIIRR